MGGGCTELPPSVVRYIQSSIKNSFEREDEHEGELIGDTLDDLCDGVCTVKDIPVIKVFRSDGHYWSADNRRLWVFKEFERLGGCDKVPVKIVSISKVNRDKITTKNGGKAVKIRGNPGGYWHSQPDRCLKRQTNTASSGTSYGATPYFTPTSSTRANPGRQSNTKSQSSTSDFHDERWCNDEPDFQYGRRSTQRYVNRSHGGGDGEDWPTTRDVIKGVIIGYIAFKLIKGLFTS